MKSRIQSAMMACVALFCAGFASCTDDALMEASNKVAGQSFELTVTQATPDSRLELGQDGLTTQWEPGDKLVLVDKTRTLAPIFLNCTLDEPASSATFVAESGVPAGDYYVIYNYNENLAYGNKIFLSVDDINFNDYLVLWNELKIEDGDYNASISLKHLYTKIKVEFKNLPSNSAGFEVGVYSSKKGFPMYKQFSNNGLVDAEYDINPNSMNYTYTTTYFPSNRKYHNVRLGSYYPEWRYDETTGGQTSDFSKAMDLSALVLPADLQGENIYFYAYNGETCYEFKKDGINFKAGTSYKVVLDMSQATVSTLSLNSYYQITNAADWRHVAYRNDRNYYELAQDIDFINDDFLPISVGTLFGNGHTLSNIKLDWADEDNVGLTRTEWIIYNNDRNLICSPLMDVITQISELTLENITVKGNNYVGAFGGYNIGARNCEVIGSSNIVGKGNYVGGIVGFNKIESYGNNTPKLVDVRIGQTCSVSGKNYVGGIVGRYISRNYYDSMLYDCPSMMLLESCKSEGTVSASEDYVGGIFGKMGGTLGSYSTSTMLTFTMEDYTFSLVKCVNEGNVTGRHYVGGIGGEYAMQLNGGTSALDRIVLSQSCSTGNVTGETKVGGILGSSMAATNICYSTGEISATTSMVGGIVGEVTGGSSSRIANCYSLATLTAGDNTCTGGIVGVSGMTTITNCYYAADSNTYSYGGIVGNSGGSVSVTNCLTTLNSLGGNLGVHQYPTGADNNGDGVADWDYNGDQIIDNKDLYYYMNDDTTGSIAAVTSILDNIAVINGDNAYSSNYWDINLYPWYCVKFASFSADTNSPDFDDETIN